MKNKLTAFVLILGALFIITSSKDAYSQNTYSRVRTRSIYHNPGYLRISGFADNRHRRYHERRDRDDYGRRDRDRHERHEYNEHGSRNHENHGREHNGHRH